MAVDTSTYLDEEAFILFLENEFELLLEDDISQVLPPRPSSKPGRNGKVRGRFDQTVISAQKPSKPRVIAQQPQSVAMSMLFDVVVDDEIMMMLA